MPAVRRPRLEELESRLAPASLVSVNLAGTGPGNNISGDHNLFLASDISTDGRYIAFLSESSDITNPSGAAHPERAVYVRDLQTNTTTLASGTLNVFSFDMSDDGRFIAIYADTTIYIRDMVAGTTEPAVTGVGGGGLGSDVFISPNGRTIAFQDDTDLTPGFVSQLFVYDSQTSQVAEVTPGNGGSGVDNVVFSADGTKVLFDSPLPAANDTNGFHDTFLYDLVADTTTLISIKADGTGPTSSGSLLGDISADGKRVLFFSEGSGLDASMPPQASSKRNLYVRDLTTNTTTVLSVDTANTFSGGAFPGASITPDGKYALWRSFYDLLDTGSGLKSTIYRKNLDTGELIRVDLRPDGGVPNGSNTLVTNLSGNIPNPQAISDDGRYVTFMSNSTDLVTGYVSPGAGVFQVYVRDIARGVTYLASNSTAGAVNGGGDSATNGGDFPVLSGDGSVVTFYSKATNLVAGDTNGERDVFAFDVPQLPADAAGAKITSAVFSGAAAGTFDKVRLTFSEAVQAGTVGTTNVTMAGPGGAITITGITPVNGSNSTQFDVAFASQSAPGTYTLNAGVGILDAAGNQLDQNGNGTNGEAADQFTATSKLAGVGSTFPADAFVMGAVDGTVQIIDASAGTVVRDGLRPLDGASPYTGLVSVALGDYDGDGTPDVFVAAANPSGAAGLDPSKAGRVFVYDGADAVDGTLTLLHTITPFATTDGPAGSTAPYVNGLNIAVGDVNGDGVGDLIAGSRGGNGTPTGGNREVGRLVVISGASPHGTNTVIGGIQKPFGGGYEKGVVVAAGNADGVGGDEVAVTRGGPVASTNPEVQRIKVKVLQLRGASLTELPLNADGTTSFAPFAGLTGAANAIKRDGRVAFVDHNGDGKAELVFSALDPLTDPTNGRVRVGVFSIDTTATTGAAAVASTGPDAGTYVTGKAVTDHAIAHVAGAGTSQNLALLTQSASSGVVYLAPLTGAPQTGGLTLSIVTGGITIDGI